MWAFSPPQIDRYRKAVADPANGAVLAAAIETAKAKPGMILDPPALKRIPSGFDADGANAELLRHKGIVVRGDGPITDALYGPQAVDLALDLFRPFVPVHEWLVANVS